MSTKIIWIRRFWEDYKPREKPSRKQFPRDIEKQVILLERSRIYPGTILADGGRLYTKQNDQKKRKGLYNAGLFAFFNTRYKKI